MGRARFGFPLLAAAVLAGGVARAAALTPTWTHNAAAGYVDGVAIGDIDADGRREIAVTMRGGHYAPDAITPGSGTLALINIDNQVLWQVTSAAEMLGYAAAGDLDGDGYDEFAVCEGGPAAVCRAYDGNGVTMFTTAPFYFPGMTNSGPSVADVNGDGYADLIIASYGGEVALIRGPLGAEAWRTDLWASYGELLFGHVAVGDVDADGVTEVVLGGWYNGGVYVLDARTGAVEATVAALGALAANPTPGNVPFFLSSGPVLAQLDGDAGLEIVALVVGTPSAVIAMEPNLQVKWWRELPADDYGYVSPVAADVDRDGTIDIFVQSVGGNLLRLNGSTGQIVSQRSLGTFSWSGPALFDLTIDGRPEVLAVGGSQFDIVNVAGGGSVVHNYANAGAAGLFPPPVAGDLDGDGKAEILVGSWEPHQLHKFDVTNAVAYRWEQFQGGPRRTGFLDTTNATDILGSDPTPALWFLYTNIVNSVASAPGRARTHLQSAYADVEDAWQAYANGNPHVAENELQTALTSLRNAASRGANTADQQKWLAYLAVQIFGQYLDRTASIVATGTSAITTGLATLAAAKNYYAAGDWVNAVAQATTGANALRTWLDSQYNSQTMTVDNCPASPSHVYQANECLLLDAMTAIAALRVTYPANSQLTSALANIKRTVAWMPDIVLNNVFTYAIATDNNLAASGLTEATAIRNTIVVAMMQNTRSYIDDVTAWRGATDPDIVSAEALYAQGVAAWQAGNYSTALARFRDAQSDAQGAV